MVGFKSPLEHLGKLTEAQPPTQRSRVAPPDADTWTLVPHREHAGPSAQVKVPPTGIDRPAVVPMPGSVRARRQTRTGRRRRSRMTTGPSPATLPGCTSVTVAPSRPRTRFSRVEARTGDSKDQGCERLPNLRDARAPTNFNPRQIRPPYHTAPDPQRCQESPKSEQGGRRRAACRLPHDDRIAACGLGDSTDIPSATLHRGPAIFARQAASTSPVVAGRDQGSDRGRVLPHFPFPLDCGSQIRAGRYRPQSTN
jgi:hypothetical protein